MTRDTRDEQLSDEEQSWLSKLADFLDPEGALIAERFRTLRAERDEQRERAEKAERALADFAEFVYEAVRKRDGVPSPPDTLLARVEEAALAHVKEGEDV